MTAEVEESAFAGSQFQVVTSFGSPNFKHPAKAPQVERGVVETHQSSGEENEPFNPPSSQKKVKERKSRTPDVDKASRNKEKTSPHGPKAMHAPKQKGTVTKATMDILRWSPVQLFGGNGPPKSIVASQPKADEKFNASLDSKLKKQRRPEPLPSAHPSTLNRTWDLGDRPRDASTLENPFHAATSPGAPVWMPWQAMALPPPLLALPVNQPLGPQDSWTKRPPATTSLAPIGKQKSGPRKSKPKKKASSDGLADSSMHAKRSDSRGNVAIVHQLKAQRGAGAAIATKAQPIGLAAPHPVNDNAADATLQVSQAMEENRKGTPPAKLDELGENDSDSVGDEDDLDDESDDEEHTLYEMRVAQETIMQKAPPKDNRGRNVDPNAKARQMLEESERQERMHITEFSLKQLFNIMLRVLDLQETFERTRGQWHEKRRRQQYELEWCTTNEENLRIVLRDNEYTSRRRVLGAFTQMLANFDMQMQQMHALLRTEHIFRKNLECNNVQEQSVLARLTDLQLGEIYSRDDIIQVEGASRQEMRIQMMQGDLALGDISALVQEEHAIRGILIVTEDKQRYVVARLNALVHEERQNRLDVEATELTESRLVSQTWSKRVMFINRAMHIEDAEAQRRAVAESSQEESWNSMVRLHNIILMETYSREDVVQQWQDWQQELERQKHRHWADSQDLFHVDGEEDSRRSWIQAEQDKHWDDLVMLHIITIEEHRRRADISRAAAQERRQLERERGKQWVLAWQKREVELQERDLRHKILQHEVYERLQFLQVIDFLYHWSQSTSDLRSLESADRMRLHSAHSERGEQLEMQAQAYRVLAEEEAAARSALDMQRLRELRPLLSSVKERYQIAQILQTEQEERAAIGGGETQAFQTLVARHETEAADRRALVEEELRERLAVTQRWHFLVAEISLALEELQGREKVLGNEAKLFSSVAEHCQASQCLIMTRPQYIFAFQGIPANIITPSLTAEQYKWALKGLVQQEVEVRLAEMLREESNWAEVEQMQRCDWEVSQQMEQNRARMVAAAIKIQSVWRMHAAKKMCRRMRGTVEATTANDETTFDNFVTELAVTTLLNRKPKQNPLNHRMSVSGPGFMPLQEGAYEVLAEVSPGQFVPVDPQQLQISAGPFPYSAPNQPSYYDPNPLDASHVDQGYPTKQLPAPYASYAHDASPYLPPPRQWQQPVAVGGSFQPFSPQPEASTRSASTMQGNSSFSRPPPPVDSATAYYTHPEGSAYPQGPSNSYL